MLGCLAGAWVLFSASTAAAEWPPPPTLPSPPAGSTCVLIQRGKLGQVWDADVSIGNGTWAAGGYPYTWTGPSPYDHRSLYRFDLSPVPAGAQVVLAMFSTYVSWNEQSSQVRIHRITAAWDELAVTAQNFPDGSWDPAVIGTFDPNGVGHRTTDVTPLVQAWKSGQVPNQGLLLEEDPVKLHAYFSSESGGNLAPSLYVCYVTGNPCGGLGEGAACDDGDPCTHGDACHSGACAGTAVVCGPADDCHLAGACNPATGQCTAVAKPDGTACEDGSVCTVNDACQSGACTGGAAVDCDDGNACTDDACDAVQGCAHVPNAASCDDGDVCTTGDKCAGGICVPAGFLSCDDGSACTVDSCDAADGCRHQADASCNGTCDATHVDCDGNPANGCETVLGGTQSCGGCGIVCPSAHGTAVCDQGQCGLAECEEGWANCDCSLSNACETNVAIDPQNCGVCGRSCAAGQACQQGACVAQ